MKNNILKNEEKIFKALANHRRLEIVHFLKVNKTATVGELARHLKISFKSTSKHLQILLGVEIVEKKQKSLLMIYTIGNPDSNIAKKIISLL